jgi:hypothetical protein
MQCGSSQPGGQGFDVTSTVFESSFDGEAWTDWMRASPNPAAPKAEASTQNS